MADDPNAKYIAILPSTINIQGKPTMHISLSPDFETS